MGLLQDVRYALRTLRTSPGFTVAAILILALGSGANTAVFSVLNAVVLHPLPYSDPARVYQIGSLTARGPAWFSVPDLVSWRERTQVFTRMTAVKVCNRILSGVDEPEQLSGLSVSAECLSLLGTSPILGRWFTDDDFKAGATRSVIIGQRLWERRFHSDPSLLGRPIVLDGVTHFAVGIMPKEFQFTERKTEFWIPLEYSARELSSLDWFGSIVFARAKSGASRDQVEAEASMVTHSLQQQFPKEHKEWRATVLPIQETLVAEARPMLWMLLGAVGCVLLIACMNVSNLFLARSTERSREMAIRMGLGADRLRLVRQLLTESTLVALVGGLLGLLLAVWANKGITALFSQVSELPRLEQTGVDGTVLGFTLLMCVASSLMFGLVPALQASKLDFNEALKETGRSGTGVRSRRIRMGIIVAETAFSLLLLVGAALMLRSFVNLLKVNPGFKVQGVLTVRLPMPAYRVPDPKRQPMYYSEILQRVQSLPGVRSAALSTVLPLTRSEAVLSIRTDDEKERFYSAFRAVSPDYFRTMEIPLILGRSFGDPDTADRARVAIVNEALSRKMWPGENPMGKQINWGKGVAVVGVVGDIKHKGLNAAPQPELYVPYLQYLGVPQSSLVLRTDSDPLNIVRAVRTAIRGFEPDQPIVDVRTMEQVVYDSIAQPRFYVLLLGIFAALAAILAFAGVYSVTSYLVSQQRHEIGIRMAIGAQHHHIIREFVGRGLKYILIGIGGGLAASFVATGLLSSLLFEVKKNDAPTYAAVSIFLLVLTVAALFAPASRATMVDPASALRHD